MLAYEYGHAMIQNSGYPLRLLSPGNSKRDLARLVEECKPDFIVCDEYRYDEEELRVLKQYGAPLMTYDHFEDHRILSDYPINAIAEECDNAYSGTGYVVIPPALTKTFRARPERIFVCFGGFDHLNITLKLVDILVRADIPLPIDVAVGNSYAHAAALEHCASMSGGKIQIYRQPPNFQELMADADIAFVAGGLVFYQALSLGVSAVVICQYDHQVAQIQNLAHHNACVLLGKGETVEVSEVMTTLQRVLCDEELRRSFYERGRRLVDGKGLYRITNIITEHLKQ